MKIVQINTTCGIGSTGKICVDISKLLTQNQIDNYILYSSKSNDYPLGIKCSNDMYIKLQALKSRIFGNYGFNSRRATEKMISELDHIKPDIVHLHNIHGHDCNLDTLLTYLKEQKIKLIWTLHDCWMLTAYCPHFVFAKCDKWKDGCFKCSQKRRFSWIFDKSSKLYEKKRELISGLDMTIITPSHWLSGIVKQSFLKKYPIKVINNGVDLNVFQPIKSIFRDKYGISVSQNIILGVAFDWGVRKGLDVFIELSKRLDNQKYQIVLVGTDDAVSGHLPSNIISIHRTTNQMELAEIYSAADIFVNTTREEVLGLVNIESLACGTPVLTFDTGGSPETIDLTCGSVVPCDDIDDLEHEIIRICNERPYTEEACVNRAKQFDKNDRYKEYLKLYKNISNDNPYTINSI